MTLMVTRCCGHSAQGRRESGRAPRHVPEDFSSGSSRPAQAGAAAFLLEGKKVKEKQRGSSPSGRVS